ncbi:MAG: HIT domain-containing protein [Bacteriovoracaceae bacterium]|nr:HIT domain-containing protein [Bacteroidota bacterium]
MKKIFSPWRSQYIATFKNEKPKKDESLFTRIIRENKDEKNLVILRKKYCFVMMNLYPYNSGHLMVVPYTQASTMSGLDSETMTEIMETLTQMEQLLTTVMKPHGFNMGANIGRVAGAGIDDHIHFHIVPRWNGDTNFMPTLGDVKVVSEDMRATYKKLIFSVKKQTQKRKK